MTDYPQWLKNTGFTLLELLVVMGIMILLMGIGLTSWLGIRRGVEMRGAVSSVRTTLLLARQQAVTRHQRVTVAVTNDVTGDYLSTSSTSYVGTNSLHATTYLPKGVKFVTANSVASVTFNPVGNVNSSGPQVIQLVDILKQQGASNDVRTITVWPLTGVTRVQ